MSPSKRFFAYRVSSQYGFWGYAVLPVFGSDNIRAHWCLIPGFNFPPPPPPPCQNDTLTDSFLIQFFFLTTFLSLQSRLSAHVFRVGVCGFFHLYLATPLYSIFAVAFRREHCIRRGKNKSSRKGVFL